MKSLKKILRWFSIIVVILIIGISTITASRQNVRYKAPYPAIKASKDSVVIARGKHLALNIAHCIHCHNNSNPDSLLQLNQDISLSGGYAFKLPLGTIYSANITPDSVNGIGRYTDGEVARALRYGVHPDGTAVYNFMPFHNMSDSDLTAVISYLRVQKPVPVKKPENDLNIMGNLVKAFMVKPVGPSEKIAAYVQPDSTAAYGRYLVTNIANCNGCHTKRNLSGDLEGELFAGGHTMDSGLTPPNLTPDSSSRIFGWSQEVFIQRFRMGKIIPNTEMPWNSFKRMSDLELSAIYKYLRTVKPAKTVAVKS